MVRSHKIRSDSLSDLFTRGSNYRFWQSVKFSITLYTCYLSCIYVLENNSSITQTRFLTSSKNNQLSFIISFVFFVSKVHDGREFQALSEYIITCSKSYPYINNKIEITREVLLKKFSFFKFLDHVRDVTLELFFSRFST